MQVKRKVLWLVLWGALWGVTVCSTGAVAASDDDHKITVVRAETSSQQIDLKRKSPPANADLGDALTQLPGASVNKNGAITQLPQYRGHIGKRTLVTLEQSAIVSAGPNLMDAPLGQVNTHWVDSVHLLRGISPVSAGSQTIGSVIEAKYWQPEFQLEQQSNGSGDLRVGFQPDMSAHDHSARLGWSNQQQRLRVFGSVQNAEDWSSAQAKVKGTEFDKRSHLLGYGVRLGAHTIDVTSIRTDTGVSGTPALPMDIIYVDSDRYQLNYQWQKNDTQWSIDVYSQEAEHLMDNYQVRTPMPTMMRENLTFGEGDGATVKYSWQALDWQLQAGIEWESLEHSATIMDPNNPMFRVENFNQVERDNQSVFIEGTRQLTSSQSITTGIRFKNTEQNAQDVSHSMAMMSPAISSVQIRFNQAGRNTDFSNIDFALDYQVKTSTDWRWHVGVGSKSRAPTYQELYLWIPLQATGGLGDGNVYVGNLELDSEVVYQFEVGFDYSQSALRFSPQIYVHKLHDYIQGRVTNDAALNMIAGMMNAGPVYQFENVSGWIYGFDADLTWDLSERWQMNTVLTMVRGERDDINEDLYRIVPDNIKWRWTYTDTHLTGDIELQYVADQSRVAASLSEQSSRGYSLVNASGEWRVSESSSLQFGVVNLFNKFYQDHTAGINRTMMNSVQPGERLPGLGRSAYVAAVIEF